MGENRLRLEDEHFETLRTALRALVDQADGKARE
jgi:hypothetical protein